MRIAFVSQPMDGVLPPRQGSIGLWTWHVARRLAAANDVSVYVPQPLGGARASTDTAADGVRFRFVATAPEGVYRVADRLLDRLRRPSASVFAQASYHAEYLWQVARDLRQLRPDVVHVHNFFQYVPFLRSRCGERVRIVLHMNCDWLTLFDRPRVSRSLACVDTVVGATDHITASIRRRFGELSIPCTTVFNGVDVDLFTPPPGGGRAGRGRSILAVGRVSPEKGLHTLVDAFVRLQDSCDDARLRIVGPFGTLPANMLLALSDDPRVRALRQFCTGDYADRLRRSVPAWLRDRVELVGFVPQAEMPRHYHEADVLVAAAYIEAFGMPVAEAAASGLPAIVTRVGGLPEVVADGMTGLLVEPGDAAGLAAALERVLRDGDLRARLGNAGRQRAVELFSWDRVAERILDVYRAALVSQRSPPSQ